MGCGGSKTAPAPRAPAASSASASPASPASPADVRPKRVITEDRFNIVKILGEGASCKVMSVKDKSNGAMYAMKVMEKSEPYNKTLWENETHILQTLLHPNILEWKESFEDKKTFHLLTVLCQGGELFDRVKNGSFSEKSAARLTRQMLEALAYCHKHNIVHRDLKPENFVFETPKEDSNMKLIDFGCAKVSKDDEEVKDVAGSPYYCAPEVLSDSLKRTGAVWKAADMWSVGVIVFLLVCGYPPFNGETQDIIFSKIKKGKFRFPKPVKGGLNLSEEVKNLITELLHMNPKNRLSAAQALSHPWVGGDVAPETPLPSSVIEGLGQFRAQCRLKKAVARVLANRMTEDDKSDLAEIFNKFDKDGNGQLGPDEVRAMMKHIGKNELEAQAMMEHMDEDGDGGVSLQEFNNQVAAGKLNNAAEIKASFDMFDQDKDGFVTHKEIERVCEFLTPELAKSLIKDVDANGDGRVNFNEWLAAMTSEGFNAKVKSPKNAQ